jgi:hypothetical protein
MRFPSFMLPRFIPYISALILSSCATTTVTDPVELPYEEKIVIRGILTAGEPVRDVFISRTVPVLAPQKPEEFWVKDAEASITSDGKSYTLTLQEFDPKQTVQRTFYAASGLIAEAGKTYTLTVRWHGKTATATTRVPNPPTPVSVRLRTVIVPSITINTITVSTSGTTPRTPPTTGSIQIRAIQDSVLLAEASFLPKEDAVYRAGLELTDTAQNLAVTSLYIGSIFTNQDIRNGILTVPASTLPTQTRKLLGGVVAARMRLYTLDVQYERYYATRGRATQSGFSLFGGTSDSNVEWNVQGGGIGLFLGMAETMVTIRP